jgi:hypothetical protein
MSYPLRIVPFMDGTGADVSRLVAGEPVGILAEALSRLQPVPSDDGMVHFELELEGALGAPLARALMRVEAELLTNDAERIVAGSPEEGRTPEQRRADALVALVLRVGDALAA